MLSTGTVPLVSYDSVIGCLYCIVRVSYEPRCFRLSLSHYHVFTGKSEQQAFYQELSLMYKFRNVPFITKLHGYCDTNEAVMLIKFYPMGALSDYVLGESPAAKIYPMSKNQMHKLLLILSQTIAYMHSQHIVHCDQHSPRSGLGPGPSFTV
ncbi:hypothetical protein MP228_006008 [Amoeboaphelidium protococcarum]|nr:hypothetical protein MP228_006008 [Amoeboaphelidium protococcarum]